MARGTGALLGFSVKYRLVLVIFFRCLSIPCMDYFLTENRMFSTHIFISPPQKKRLYNVG